MSKILVTGAAGFIGFHLARRLLAAEEEVVGLDNLNDYYSVQLKKDRLAQLEPHPRFRFHKLDLADRPAMSRLFETERFDAVIHLAAQAGVRYSLTHPHAYIDSNLVGFTHVLEGCRHAGVGHLVYASSSSVYGANTTMPFSVHDNVDHPLSLYAATKKANELMAHAYSHLYRLPTTGLRFFTVYGPWGRPDMAPVPLHQGDPRRRSRSTSSITARCGATSPTSTTSWRGWRGSFVALPQPDPQWSGERPDPGSSAAPYRLYNIGNNQPVELLRLIETLEDCLGRRR